MFLQYGNNIWNAELSMYYSVEQNKTCGLMLLVTENVHRLIPSHHESFGN